MVPLARTTWCSASRRCSTSPVIAGVTTALLLGAPLVLAYRFEPSVMLETIRDERATFTVGSTGRGPDQCGGHKVWPREVEDVLYRG